MANAARADEVPSWLSYAATSSHASAAVRAVKPAVKAAQAKTEVDEVDTEHIFGFSMGSDIGKKGEIELEIENVGHFGRRSGSYTGIATLSQVKYTLTDDFRIAPGISTGTTQISDVPGMANSHRTAFTGASVEVRYRVLDRDVMPFGLTLHAAPGWNRVDDVTGLDVQSYGSEFAALMDKELIRNTLFAAVNIWYSAGASRDVDHVWSHDSEFAIHGALSYRLNRDVVVGGEVRYVRAYGGMGLDHFAGDAVYIGPTLSMNVTKDIGLSGTFSTQVAGKAVDDPRNLDLTNFERHQGMVRVNYHF